MEDKNIVDLYDLDYNLFRDLTINNFQRIFEHYPTMSFAELEDAIYAYINDEELEGTDEEAMVELASYIHKIVTKGRKKAHMAVSSS